MTLAPRAVVVHRRSELDELVDRHGTRGQVEFFLRTRGRSLAEVQGRHDALDTALRQAREGIPADWRRGDVERGDLHRFGFDPEDVCLVVGPDGLVANTAKYLAGQPVIGIDPEPGRNPGVLVRHLAASAGRLLDGLTSGRTRWEERTLVLAVLDDGSRIEALNELFVGHPSHQSARYRLAVAGEEPEQQSSSGVVVSTGTGATGWATSIVRERAADLDLPTPGSTDLAWFVREAWPSPLTGTSLTAGLLSGGAELVVTVQSDALVVFGDGLEADRLVATWGQSLRLGASARRLRLVV